MNKEATPYEQVEVALQIGIEEGYLKESILDKLKLINATPTEEEVCKALSEYWGNPVKYNKEKRLFVMYMEDGRWVTFDMLRVRHRAPHLITLIGRFYSSLVD
jgi:hypothetical protein